ncbi:MAG: hypothetical protein GX443_15190 [Deltaproteobacteria bacterium]|nr:hypothetical protein [Deltaproteobacteria bacterium]
MTGFLRTGLYRLMHGLERHLSSHYSPRVWSNGELRRLGHLFQGDVINVSGGKDSDKEGHLYRDYFPNASSYRVSNHLPLKGAPRDQLILDLEWERLPESFEGRFDVVFTHTVLEHVYRMDRALENLCRLSRDIVLTVVPFIQSFHCGKTYGDYWRFSPTAICRLLKDRGLETLYLTWNDHPLGNLYIFHVASKCPEKWETIRKAQPPLRFGPGYMRSYAGARGHRDTELSRCPDRMGQWGPTP